jgi:aspartyl protease family protein
MIIPFSWSHLMLRRSAKVCVLTVLFLSSAGLSGFSADPQTPRYNVFAATELKAEDNGHFYAKASINDSMVTVVVDTGATVVAIPYEDAEKIGLHPRTLRYNVQIATANGLVKAAEVSLRRVEINGVKVNDVNGIVMPKGALNVTLLGMSYLSKLQGFSVERGVLKLKN